MKPIVYIIGVGGVGSWIAPTLVNLTSPEQVVFVDGDKLEEKNLDRQLFSPNDVGRYKAEALADRHGCEHRAEWFSNPFHNFGPLDWLIVCVDNHTARKAALSECDRTGCSAIIAANETHSAEAYVYRSEWEDSKADPRVYYPDILTDKSGDPRRASIGCTGEAQRNNPQLVTSNAMAAALAGHLFAFWYLKASTVSKSMERSFPVKMVANMTKLESYKLEEMIKL